VVGSVVKQILFFLPENNAIKEGASWTYDTLSVIDKIFSKTNHMQISFCFLAAYTQLETPSEVAIAVRMLIAI
jgi:hypothetical protein